MWLHAVSACAAASPLQLGGAWNSKRQMKPERFVEAMDQRDWQPPNVATKSRDRH